MDKYAQYQTVKAFLDKMACELDSHLYDPNDSQKIGQAILSDSPAFIKRLDHNDEAVAGTWSLKLETRQDALTDLTDDYLNNSDISEDNNRGFRRSIQCMKADRHPVYLFNGCSDSYTPVTNHSLMIFMLYAEYMAHHELLGVDDTLIHEIVDTHMNE